MKNITAKQMEKGTEIVKFSAAITDCPENLEELTAMVEASDADGFANQIIMALAEYARGKTIGRLAQLQRGKSELFTSISFEEVLTTTVRKLTAASMCTRIGEEVQKLAGEMSAAVDAEDFALVGEINGKLKEKKAELVAWEEKREVERKRKAATREANKEK
jgi:hypothetical protein